MPILRTFITFGTRPEAIKMAPIIDECRRRAGQIEPIVCLTGQHHELLSQVRSQKSEVRSQESGVRVGSSAGGGLAARFRRRRTFGRGPG